MSVTVNEVRRGTYLDSVALMRIAQQVKAVDGVEECGMMMATPANRQIMADAGVLAENGATAQPGDLVIAIRARDAAAADAALVAARAALDRPRMSADAGGVARVAPRTLRAGIAALGGSNLALISVPGTYAASEAMKALSSGLNVMIFSDNVPVADEVSLKREAARQGLLLMGPDCGTAIIAGTPLAFANVVPRGDIGIIGASGTGIQEVTALIAQGGGGISHAIGTGGRDLKVEVGGLTTLAAIGLLDADPGTRQIVLISKPPASIVAGRVMERVARSSKPFTICFIGGGELVLPPNARCADTLEAAAQLVLGHSISGGTASSVARRKGYIWGLFAGGTLCVEAQVVLRAAGLALTSNVPIDGVTAFSSGVTAHSLLDLGDDAYTVGRPHPMIEPAVRDEPLAEALADPDCAVVLLDCVLGHGAHSDPAGHIVSRIRQSRADGPVIVASVTGTEGDPQGLSVQRDKLLAAGVHVAASNAEAARVAANIVGGG